MLAGRAARLLEGCSPRGTAWGAMPFSSIILFYPFRPSDSRQDVPFVSYFRP